MTILDMKQNRAKLITDARTVLDAAEAENRDLSEEEKRRWDTMLADADKIADKIKDQERQAALESGLDELETEGTRMAPEDREHRDGHWSDRPEYRAAFWDYIAGRADIGQVRALQMDSDTAGGYAVLPQAFVGQLLTKLKDMVFIRQRATVYSIPKAASLGVPALDNDPDDSEWTGEITTRSEDSAMSFGKRELRPNPSAKLIKVSKKLLRASSIDMEALVRDRLSYKFAITEEKTFLTGHGSGRPLGLFTASTDGIGTGRDISTGNTGTEMRTDGLMEAKYGLKMGYRANAAWIFHRDGVKQIAKLKDGEGRYLLVPDLRSAGALDRVLSYPVYESEYAPNTFTTGNYVGLLGDLSYYWIADALNMTIQRLIELYAATNQDGFIGLMEADGMPALEEAFVRVTLA